jgi:hypothetical protein
VLSLSPPSPSSTPPPLRKSPFTFSRTQLTPLSCASTVSRRPRQRRAKSIPINPFHTLRQRSTIPTRASSSRRPLAIWPRHLHATTERHMIVFIFFSLDAHGASLLGGSQRISSPNFWTIFFSQPTDKLKRLQTQYANYNQISPLTTPMTLTDPSPFFLNPVLWQRT